MDDFLRQYALFLAQTVTLVVAVVVVVAAVSAVARRGRQARPGRPGLHVRNLGQRYDDLAVALRAGAMPRAAARRELKAHRRRRKAAAKADPALGAGGQPAGTGDTPAGTGPPAVAGTPTVFASDTPHDTGADRGGARRAGGGRSRIFVLDFHGDIRASAVRTLREEISALVSVAGPGDEVLLRLENPGGLVTDHGLAAAQLLRLRRRGIPLTVAVDKVAASGGYMMASVADRILAAPFAAVGSIGVIAALPNFSRLLDRNGIDYEQFTGGDHKRTVTLFGRTTDADRRKLTEEIEDTHALFKEFVAEYRPRVDLARAATGQAWYGTRAVDLGLVDELTTSDDYLLAARERADVFAVSFVPDRPLAAGLARWRSAVEGRLTNLLPGG